MLLPDIKQRVYYDGLELGNEWFMSTVWKSSERHKKVQGCAGVHERTCLFDQGIRDRRQRHDEGNTLASNREEIKGWHILVIKTSKHKCHVRWILDNFLILIRLFLQLTDSWDQLFIIVCSKTNGRHSEWLSSLEYINNIGVFKLNMFLFEERIKYWNAGSIAFASILTWWFEKNGWFDILKV